MNEMNIGETIRRLRRERNITQEELGEYLGISAKAVSQWECARTMPDISQLPVLANVLEVTTDELLGVDVDAKKRKIAECSLRSRGAFEQGARKKAEEILREGLLQYPDSYLLMEQLVSYLCCHRTEEVQEEVCALFERILSGCTDNALRNRTTVLACRIYSEIGRSEEALRLAESMEGAKSRLELLPDILDGRAGFEAHRDLLSKLVNGVFSEMFDYAGRRDENGNYFFNDEERLAIYKKALDGFAVFFENGDYMYEAQVVEMAAKEAARISIRCGNLAEAIEFAAKCADASIQFDTYDWEKPHTSLLWRNLVFGGYCREAHNRSYDILECFSTDEDFSKLRGEKKFDIILEKLRKIAK